jgi:cell division septation protein DedD
MIKEKEEVEVVPLEQEVVSLEQEVVEEVITSSQNKPKDQMLRNSKTS